MDGRRTVVEQLWARLLGPRVRRSPLSVARFRENVRQAEPPIPSERDIPTTFAWFERLQVDPQGRLWVLRRTGAAQYTFDVFSPEGEPVATLPLPSAILATRPIAIGPQSLYAFVKDADDLIYLTRWSIGMR
jgi:hypothetical protein